MTVGDVTKAATVILLVLPLRSPGNADWGLAVFTVISGIPGIRMLSQPRTPASPRTDDPTGKRQNSVPWGAHPWPQPSATQHGASQWASTRGTFSICWSESYLLSNLLGRPTVPIPLGKLQRENSLPREEGMPNPVPLRFSHFVKGFYGTLTQVLEFILILPKLWTHQRAV